MPGFRRPLCRFRTIHRAYIDSRQTQSILEYRPLPASDSFMKRPRFIPDNFTLILIGLVVLATVLPVQGEAAHIADLVTNFAIALLFFLHGAKLPTQAVIAGLAHWRLHGLVFACTFLLFPLVGLALK